MKRQIFVEELQKQQDTTWDIIVIGGGATGLGVALDGVSRGFKTLLLEQSDFAKGTSSRSTKLVHGGVRYLAQGDMALVVEALHERGLMMKNAPHLTSNQEFIIPVYRFWDAFVYTMGMKFYDLLSGPLSLGKSYFINPKKTLARLPMLKSQGLIGGVVYHDGQFDDSRMAIALAQKCAEKGCIVLNYFKVTDLSKNEYGIINGVNAKDINTGEAFRFKSKLVINATGVFADGIKRMDNPGAEPTIKPSRGVHIVLDKSFLQSKSALLIPKTEDGRVLFAIPWNDVVVVGTTDRPLDTISLEPVAQDNEIDFILQTAQKYFTRPPHREDILCTFAGLRPLAANPNNPVSTKAISRRHKITLSTSGLLTIIGGKWTTYRRMAEETINKAISAGLLNQKNCITADLKLTTLTNGNGSNRLNVYGDQSFEIEKMISDNPGLGIPIDPRFPYTTAEIIWICRNEMPLLIEDVLARRTHALFLNAKASLDIAAKVAMLMAKELGRNAEWEKEQIESYNQLVKNYI